MQFSAPIILTALLGALLPAGADSRLEARMTAAELERAGLPRERIHVPVEAYLVTPGAGLKETVEPRSGTLFRSACFAYLDENGVLVRRFEVYAPDAEALPLARNAARFMTVLWSMADRRLGTLSSRLRSGPLKVWLTRTGRPGGEQIGSNVYIYDILADRSRIEWVRQLTHEYGHYLLPGASGYSDPEDWSNGLLGERLFLKWLRDDIVGGRIKEQVVPFAKLADLEDYCAKQPEPLISRVLERGVDLALLKKRDASAMDELSALLLFSDATYGSRSLLDLLDHLPRAADGSVRPEGFHAALAQLVSTSPSFSTTIPPGPLRLLLPRGQFRVTPSAPVTAITIDKGSAGGGATGSWVVHVTTAGWRTVNLTSASPVTLRWEKL